MPDKRKPALTLLFAIALIHASFAQSTFSIYGTVTDDSKKTIDDGIATLLRRNDSGFVALTDITGGRFVLSTNTAGNYLIRITSYGYDDQLREISLSSDQTVAIELKRLKTELKELQVTGHKDVFSYRHGNIKANVENTILATLPEPIEILSKLPTVMVSADRENVSIAGRGGPLIYLDNQRITLNELNALSVNDIRTIEVINHPSAKYEADGRAVILVTRRVNRTAGSRIDITETAAKKRYFENRAGLNASFKRGKTEWKANAQHNFATRFEGLIGVMNAADSDYQSHFNGTSAGPRHQYLFGAGMYRQLNETDYLSINLNGRVQKERAGVQTRSYIDQNGVATNALTTNTNTGSRPFGNASFNYQKGLKKINSQLFIGAQYSQHRINVLSDITNYFQDTNLQESENRRQDFLVDVGVARVDFKKTFKNNITWESGGNISVSRSGSVFNIDYEPVKTQLRSNFRYNEDNEALYTQISGTRRKISYAAGLRLENTVIQGRYKDSSRLLADRNFMYLFPKANITVPLDSSNEITVNYARTIRRPNYSNANQVSNYITPFLERANNININPNLTDEVSVNYQYRKYSLEATAYQTTNPSWYVTRYDSTLKKVSMVNTNLERTVGATISLTLPFTYKKYTTNNVLMTQIEQTKDSRAAQVGTQPFFYLYSNNQFRLPGNFTFVLSAWITTDQRQGILERKQQFSVDLSLSKVFFKKLTCTINAFDIFRSLNFVESYRINGIYSSTTYLENQKEFSVNIRYSFGVLKDARFKSREVNENSGRLN